MIAKKFRLTEKEVQKVFKHKKPFFSRGWIANTRKNNLPYHRIAILLSSKHTKGAVHRNFFRRNFYDTLAKKGLNGGLDIVFVPKRGQKFDSKNPKSVSFFLQGICELYRQIQK